MGLARRRTGAAAVRRRKRSVRGRPAPRHRHRRPDGDGRALRGERDRVVCGAVAASRALPHRADRRRLLRHARPPGVDRGHERNPGLRGRRGRDDRAERRRRRRRALRLPRDQAHGRPQRVPRPADAASLAPGA